MTGERIFLENGGSCKSSFQKVTHFKRRSENEGQASKDTKTRNVYMYEHLQENPILLAAHVGAVLLGRVSTRKEVFSEAFTVKDDR